MLIPHKVEIMNRVI